MKKEKEEPKVLDDLGEVDLYYSKVPKNQLEVLLHMRQLIKTIVPDTTEIINCRIPIFTLFDKPLVGISVYQKYCRFHTISFPVINDMENELSNYSIVATIIHFEPENPMPDSLIEKIVKYRIAENEAKQAKREEKKKTARK